MSTESISRKQPKWLAFIALFSVIALLFRYTIPSRHYSYYRKAVFFRQDISETKTRADNVMMNWTDTRGTTHEIPMEAIISKSFSYSGKTNMIPYYYKANMKMIKKDITLVTLVTRNRIPNLARLAKQYKGPISTTIHLTDDEEGDYTLEILENTMEKNPEMREYVDVHIVRDNFDRELNLWRNVAKLFARTEYVMMLDIDFYPCTRLRENVLNNPKAMELLDSGSAALVIPAFEYSKQSDGLDYRTFPKTKKDLVDEYKENKIEMFHSFWLPGHAPTEYDRWTAFDQEIYPVTSYQHSYEPYVIFKNQGSPWCDERFAGYGSNKAACLYELYISGVSYHVLPNDFIIHQTHAYPDQARNVERYYNRRLYTQFREELCIRLARRFISQNKWDHPQSSNLRTECDSIKPYRRAISRFS